MDGTGKVACASFNHWDGIEYAPLLISCFAQQKSKYYITVTQELQSANMLLPIIRRPSLRLSEPQSALD